MVSSQWQKQHIHFRAIIWGVSAVISVLLIIPMLLLGFGLEMAGVFFIVLFFVARVSLAFIFKNRFANTMVRILKFDYEEIERDFRLLFKHKFIRYHRKLEADLYRYDFPGHKLSLIVQPYWLPGETKRPFTKLILQTITAENKEFAETLAEAIDEMAAQRMQGLVSA